MTKIIRKVFSNGSECELCLGSDENGRSIAVYGRWIVAPDWDVMFDEFQEWQLAESSAFLDELHGPTTP